MSRGTNNPCHVLIVDDEAEMRDAVREYLTLRGFRVSQAADGEQMNAMLVDNTVDLILLDLNLPGEDGISLTRRLKSQKNIGIIIVTAYGESEDRVLGLESGADDYVVKPFNFRELVARINSVLRRLSAADDKQHETDSVVKVGEWSFDRFEETLSKADGVRLHLSAAELDLLAVLIDNQDRVMSRDELLDKLSNREWDPFDRSIDVRVTRLRRKIETDPTKPKSINTVRGVGYVFKPTR
jgi:DNA-binding response OmpR family regulator